MKYHYVYRITNLELNKHYYGCRTSKIDPKLDLGTKYYSSSSDKDFVKDQKENPQKYNYKVIKIFDKREDAVKLEIKLHNKFNVGVNESFYNRSKQTSVSFDTTGISPTVNNRIKTSERTKGTRLSEEQKKKISDSLKGKRHTPERIQKTKESLIGLTPWNKGIACTEEQKKKISDSLKGEKNVRFGTKHSLETIDKMKKPKKIVMCPYCNKHGGISQMKRWHFKNCNIKETND